MMNPRMSVLSCSTKATLVSVVVFIASFTSVECAIIITDDFSDNEVPTPSSSVAKTSWLIKKGIIVADGSLTEGGNMSRPGELYFSPQGASEIAIDFGDVVVNTPVTVTFTLATPNEGISNYTFGFELRDRERGEGYAGVLGGNPEFFGTSGMMSYNDLGQVVSGLDGAVLQPKLQQRVDLIFDDLEGVKVKVDGELVAEWKNFKKINKVDQLVLSASGGIGWRISDLTIDAILDNN